MLIQECGINDEIFEWIDPNTQKHVFFNATKLQEVAISCVLHDIENIYGVEYLNIAMDREFASFILENRGIDIERAKSLPEYVLKLPIIVLEMSDGTTLTIDGHHRIYRLFLDNKASYPALRYPLGQWDWAVVEFSDDFQVI